MSYLRSRVVKLYEGMDESEEDEKDAYDQFKEQEMDEDPGIGRVLFPLATNSSSSVSRSTHSKRGGPTRHNIPPKNSEVFKKRRREEENEEEEEEVEENEEEEVEEEEEEEEENEKEEENEEEEEENEENEEEENDDEEEEETDCGLEATIDPTIEGPQNLLRLTKKAAVAVKKSSEAASGLAFSRSASTSASTSTSTSTVSSKTVVELISLSGATDKAYFLACKGNTIFTTNAIEQMKKSNEDTNLRREAVKDNLPRPSPLGAGWLTILRPLILKHARGALSIDHYNARIDILKDQLFHKSALSELQFGQLFDPNAVLFLHMFPVDWSSRFTWMIAKNGRLDDSGLGAAVCESMNVALGCQLALFGIPMIQTDLDPVPRHWDSGRSKANDRQDYVDALARLFIRAGFRVIVACGKDGESVITAMGLAAKDVGIEFGYSKGKAWFNGVTLLLLDVHHQNMLPTKYSALVHAQRLDDVTISGLRSSFGLGPSPRSMVGHVLRSAEGLHENSIGTHFGARELRATELETGEIIPFDKLHPSVQSTVSGAGITKVNVGSWKLKTKEAQMNWDSTGPSFPAVALSIHGTAGGLSQAFQQRCLLDSVVTQQVPLRLGGMSKRQQLEAKEQWRKAGESMANVDDATLLKTSSDSNGGFIGKFGITNYTKEQVDEIKRKSRLSHRDTFSQLRAHEGSCYGGLLGGTTGGKNDPELLSALMMTDDAVTDDEILAAKIALDKAQDYCTRRKAIRVKTGTIAGTTGGKNYPELLSALMMTDDAVTDDEILAAKIALEKAQEYCARRNAIRVKTGTIAGTTGGKNDPELLSALKMTEDAVTEDDILAAEIALEKAQEYCSRRNAIRVKTGTIAGTAGGKNDFRLVQAQEKLLAAVGPVAKQEAKKEVEVAKKAQLSTHDDKVRGGTAGGKNSHKRFDKVKEQKVAIEAALGNWSASRLK